MPLSAKQSLNQRAHWVVQEHGHSYLETTSNRKKNPDSEILQYVSYHLKQNVLRDKTVN